MYIDLHETAHQRFAAYETDIQDSLARQFDVQMKSIENNYKLGQAEIGARLKAASISANASVKSAKIGANASIKVAEMNNATSRYGIDVQASVDREKIAQAREEMLKVGIPSMLVDAWTAQKNYELARMSLGLDIAKTAAEYRSTPDRYWLAADFEAALPALLNSAGGQAGGGLNGITGSPGGAPTPNSLEALVASLTGTGSTATQGATGTGGPLGTGSEGNIYDQVLKMSGEAPSATAGAGTGATSGTSAMGPTSGGDYKSFFSALMGSGLQAIGGLPLNGTINSSDLAAWFSNLGTEPHSEKGGGFYDPLDPKVKAVADAARAAGFDMSYYDQWVQKVHPPTPAAAPEAAPAPAVAPVAAVDTGQPAATAGLTPQDATMLAGASAAFAGGLDPFMLQKLDPTQRDILLAAGKRLGYDVNSELFKASTRLPGQGDALAA